MLSVDHARWGQTPEDLRRLAVGAPHRRTRERFLALHEIARGGCATRVAVRAGRHPQTVMGWLHAYDAHGPDALAYRRTGGRPPFVPAPRPASARSFAPPSAPPPPRP
jgi:transposase